MHYSNRHTGERFTRLTLLYQVGHEKCGNARWHVRCDCGTEFDASLTNILSGNTRSCGCLKKERIIAFNKSRSKKQQQLNDTEQ